MQHYFALGKNDQHLYFTNEDNHHITHVMRFHPNDKVIGIFNGIHYEVSLSWEENQVIGTIITRKEVKTELPYPITLVVGLPRQEKWDLILQKATELGVSRIVPWLSERSIIRLDSSQIITKMKRWKLIIKEAAEQSERQILPVLELPTNKLNFDLFTEQNRYIAFERASPIPTLFDRFHQQEPQSTVVVIGPEGGLTDHEIRLFEQNRFQVISLGPRILRSETAVFYILSVLSFMAEESPNDL